MINVVLYQPQIPQNTGNIGRLCVSMGIRLHLIHPLGFNISSKELKRAGMDYWPLLDLVEHKDYLEFLNSANGSLFYITTKATKPYFCADFSNIKEDIYLIFGREDAGFKNIDLAKINTEKKLLIPMLEDFRSINLSTSVGIVLGEALRATNGFRIMK